MCDILLIILGCIQIGKMLRAKGADAGMYQVMFVAACLIGEIGGAVLGFVISGGGREAPAVAGLFALIGFACGGGTVFFMASSVKGRKTNYGSSSGGRYGGGYGASNNNQQILFPPNLQDPYASPQQYPPQQYPPSPYQQPHPQQPFPQQGYPPYPPQPAFPPPPPPAPYPPQPAAAIRFACPQGHILEDDSSAVGQQRCCPMCNTTFVVPGPAVPQARPVAAPPGAVRRPPGPPKRG